MLVDHIQGHPPCQHSRLACLVSSLLFWNKFILKLEVISKSEQTNISQRFIAIHDSGCRPVHLYWCGFKPSFKVPARSTQNPTQSIYPDTGLTSPALDLKWSTLTKGATDINFPVFSLTKRGIEPLTRSERSVTRLPRQSVTALNEIMKHR